MTLLQALVLPLLFAAASAVGGGFLGVYVDDSEAGPIVQSVIPDTPAARAGFTVGDRFVSVDGKETPNRNAFLEVLGSHDPGDAVQIVFARAGATITKKVVLGKRPQNLEGGEAEKHEAKEQKGEEREGQAEKATARQDSAKTEETKASAEAKLRPRGSGQPYLGVQVSDADGGAGVDSVVEGSPAARAGLADGDVIVRVGRAAVDNVAGLHEALGKAKVGDRTDVVVRRDDQRITLKVQLGARDAEAVDSPRPPAAAERPREPRAAARSEPRRARDDAAAVEAEASDDASAVRALRREIRDLRREIAELRKMVDKLDR